MSLGGTNVPEALRCRSRGHGGGGGGDGSGSGSGSSPSPSLLRLAQPQAQPQPLLPPNVTLWPAPDVLLHLATGDTAVPAHLATHACRRVAQVLALGVSTAVMRHRAAVALTTLLQAVAGDAATHAAPPTQLAACLVHPQWAVVGTAPSGYPTLACVRVGTAYATGESGAGVVTRAAVSGGRGAAGARDAVCVEVDRPDGIAGHALAVVVAPLRVDRLQVLDRGGSTEDLAERLLRDTGARLDALRGSRTARDESAVMSGDPTLAVTTRTSDGTTAAHVSSVALGDHGRCATFLLVE
jgi:hypothetical protein